MSGAIGPSAGPPWALVVALMLVGDGDERPFHGVVRVRDVASQVTTDNRVWVDGGRSRVEVEGGATTIRTDGEMWIIRPDDPEVAERADSGFVADGPHDVLLRRRLDGSYRGLGGLGRLVGGPRAVEVNGRRAWNVRLERDDQWPSTVTWAVDAERGYVLRETDASGLVVAEWLELVVGEPAPEGAFTWDGPVRARTLDQEHEGPSEAERARVEELRKVEALGLAGLRVPFSGEVSVHESKRNGSFEVELMSHGFAMLSRRPVGAPKRRGWTTQHVHTWSDDRWDWSLAVSSPLTDAELDAVRAQLPD